MEKHTLSHGNALLIWALICWVIAPAPAWTAEPARKTIAVLGDSIAAGSGVDPEEAYPALLQKRIDADKLPYEVINAGVSGDTTAGGVRRLPWLMRRQIDVLVIELGGNDGLRGIPPEETRTNLEKIITLAREKYPDIQIITAGMQMPQNMGEDYNRKFRGLFETVAKEKNTALIPFILEGVGGKAELNLPDRIHPNPQGHKIVADNVWAVLGPILKKNHPRNAALKLSLQMSSFACYLEESCNFGKIFVSRSAFGCGSAALRSFALKRPNPHPWKSVTVRG